MKYRRDLLKALMTGSAVTIAGCLGSDDSESDDGNGDGNGNENGDGNGDGGDGNSGETSAGQTPETGGTLRVPSTLNLATLNGLLAFEAPQYIASAAMNGTLTQIGPDRSVHPSLATDWESSDGAKVWTFELRDDARWHHSGNKVLAEDVAGTANAIYAEESQARGKGSLGPLEEAEVINDNTVEFRLSQPDGNIPLKWGLLASVIYPKDVVQNRWEEMGSNDFGCGPFELDEYVSDGVSRFSAFDDFYLEDDNGSSLPYVDSFELHVLPDTSTMLTAYENQDVDLIQEVPGDQWSRVKDLEGTNSQVITTGKFPVIEMKATEPPFDDNRVRKAFKYAVNRDEILAGAVVGLGTVANDHPISSSYPQPPELDNQYSEDLDQAQALLEEAGYGEGGESIELTLEGVNNPTYVRNTMVIAAGHLNRLPNVNIEVLQQSVDTWYAESWQKARFYISWWSGGVTEAYRLRRIWHSDGQYNEAAFSDDEFDQAVDTAARSTSKEERAAAIQKACAILHERGPSIIPIFLDKAATNHDYTHGFEAYPYNRIVRSHEIWLDENAPTK